MMLLAGAQTDCLKKKEDSIDLYNKCRGREPLKKISERNIEIYENFMKQLSEILMKQLSEIFMKQLSEILMK